MEMKSRLPTLREVSFDGASMWFSEMQCGGLLFHPEDDAVEFIGISDGISSFSEKEVKELRFFLGELEKGLGHEKMTSAASPIFMKASGIQLDS